LGILGNYSCLHYFSKLITENCGPGEVGLDAGVFSSSEKPFIGFMWMSSALVNIPSKISKIINPNVQSIWK
jgi:hypothetical protein